MWKQQLVKMKLILSTLYIWLVIHHIRYSTLIYILDILLRICTQLLHQHCLSLLQTCTRYKLTLDSHLILIYRQIESEQYFLPEHRCCVLVFVQVNSQMD